VVRLVRAALLDLAEALELLEPRASQGLRVALDLPDSQALRALASDSLPVVVSAVRAGLLVRVDPRGHPVSAPSAPRPSPQLELPGAAASPSRPSTSGVTTGRRR